MALSMNDKYGDQLRRIADRFAMMSEVLEQAHKRLEHDTEYQLADTLRTMTEASNSANQKLADMLRIVEFNTRH